MRYEVRSQDDERSVKIEAVDWMMAMSQAIETWKVQVSGWSCSTRANGDVHVQDPTSGRKWVVSPLRTETARRPLRKGRTTPPPPPQIGKSLGAPPPPAVRSLKPRLDSASAPADATDAPPLPRRAPVDATDAPPVPRRRPPVAEAPKPELKAKPIVESVAAPIPERRAKPAPEPEPILRPAGTPKLKLPTEAPHLPDYGKEDPRPVVRPERYSSPGVPIDAASPSIAKEPLPNTGAITMQPENLAERLFELADEISEAVTAYEACELTLELCMEAIKSEAGSVLRGSLNDQALTFVACEGPAGDALIGRKLRFGRGIVGAAFDLSFTIVVNDVDLDERHLSKVDEETGFVTRNVLCTPIRSDDEHFGVLQLLNVNGGFQGWHVQVTESLAGSLAAALAAGLH